MIKVENLKLKYHFKDKYSLYLAYMPFVKNGGLFIPNLILPQQEKSAQLILRLFNESTSYEIESNLIWVTPSCVEGSKPAGIGFQFIGGNSQVFCEKVETYLADMLKSIHATYTM